MSFSNQRLPGILSFIFILTLSPASFAAWTLDGEASSLYYVTSKAAAISELNSFGELSGSIDDGGNASISISLGSVDTAVDIRNERMREIVFQVSSYPLAMVSLSTDSDMLGSLEAGDNATAMLDATLSIHGSELVVPVEVVITGLKEGGLLVAPSRPLIINIASLGLAGAVEQLREIAALPSINNNIVVDFTLQFDESR